MDDLLGKYEIGIFSCSLLPFDGRLVITKDMHKLMNQIIQSKRLKGIKAL